MGKSCLTVQFVQGIYIDVYDPTIEDSYSKEIEVDERPCNLEILDTAGVAQFTAMRELYIKNGQGFILVYSVTDKKSLEELRAIREQISRIKGTNNVPMVLVGNKCDLTEERELQPEDGIQVSTEWSKVPFYETSALLKMNVDDAFVDVVRQIIRKEVQQQNEDLLEATSVNKQPQSIASKRRSIMNLSGMKHDEPETQPQRNTQSTAPVSTQKNLPAAKPQPASESGCCVIA